MTYSRQHPWEKIYAQDGRVFTDLLPAFHAAVDTFSKSGCQKILDLGCGNGRHTVGFARAGFQTTGLDISDTGLSITRDWLLEAGVSANLLRGDTRHILPLSGNSFEGLFSTQVIHHALLEEIQLTIREIWRVISPGGLAFISVAGRTHSDTAYEEIEPGTFLPLDGSEKGLPHHIFSEKELRQEFNYFEILEIDSRDHGRVLIIWVRKPSA